MLKVTYQLKGTFSLKEANDGHLMARTTRHITRSTIRGALLAMAFAYKGDKWAEDNFYKIKEAAIFPQLTRNYGVHGEKRSRIGTKAMSKNVTSNEKKRAEARPNSSEGVGALTTVGNREYLYTESLSFYIDETIEDVVELLSNITRLGDSESLVELKSIEKVDKLENILMPQSEDFDYKKEYIYDTDWAHINKFEYSNAYSEKYGRKAAQLRCEVMDVVL